MIVVWSCHDSSVAGFKDLNAEQIKDRNDLFAAWAKGDIDES